MLHAFNLFNWLRTGRFLKKECPDLVVIRFWLPLMAPAFGTLLRIVRRNGHTRIIAITDNVLPHEKRPGDKWLTRYFLRACDAFVCMSKKVYDDLRSFRVSGPVRQLEHPLYDAFGDKVSKEEARKKLNLPADKRILLFFGFIRKYKGLDLLLAAMQQLQNDEVVLLVAGEFYEQASAYEPLLGNLQAARKLILQKNFIPNEEIRYYFSAADGLIQPYRSATQSGVTPLAYHFDLPMIVTNVGGLPDYVIHERTGLVTSPEPAAIAAAISRYFALGESHFTPELRREKQRFSWQVFASGLLELYTELERK
ncbi:MAG: glycosyltransferase [Flavihumibacter sp.]